MGFPEHGDSVKSEEELGLGLESAAPSPSMDAAIESLDKESQSPSMDADIKSLDEESQSLTMDEAIKSLHEELHGLSLESTAPSPSMDAAMESLYKESQSPSMDAAIESFDEKSQSPSMDAAVESLNVESQSQSQSIVAAIESLNEGLHVGLEEDRNDLEDESASNEVEEEERKDYDLKEEKKDGRFHHPVRPNEPDCSFYLRTGMCKFGSNCRFNHPPRQKNQVGIGWRKNEKENEKEEVNEKEKDDEASEEKEDREHVDEEFPERKGLPECKYFMKTGGCKFGKACRYNHPRAKAGAGEPVDLNFLGLPIRPREKECPYYMRTGSCKFATNCRFHHPDPTAVGGCDPLPVYRNDKSLTLRASTASPPLPTSWSRISNEQVPYMEVSPPPYVPVMLPPPHAVHPNSEWNGFLGPGSALFPLERNSKPPSASASAMIDPTKKPDSFTPQHQMVEDEYPERPGQQECQFYMKTGNCKFKSACRYHHPKARVSKSSATCALSSMGLPLRPDQIICVHYSRYGICKFGPACKYDHPVNCDGLSSSATSASNQTPLDKSTSEEARVST